MARSRLVCLALALVTLLIYLPVWRHGFVLYDDPDYLTENRIVQNGLTWHGIKWAFTTWHANNWHPLTWLSHMLDCELFGLDPGPHHLVSVMFHIANAVLLLFVLLRLTHGLWQSAFVAALFALHPLHVQSVAWAAERKDVLSTFFFLLTLWAYIRYVEESREESGERRKGRAERNGKRKAWNRFYLLSAVFYLLSLLSKPMLVTLPFLLLLLDYWPLQRFDIRFRSGPNTPSLHHSITPFLDKFPFLLLSLGSCVVTFLAQRSEAVIGLIPFPLGLRLQNAVVSYAQYLLKMLWPADLAVIYPLPHQLAGPKVLLAAVFLFVISMLVWRFRRERPHLLVGWLWYLGTLVPVIGVVQVGGQAMADRYTYVPLIGIFIAVAVEGGFWVKRFGLRALALAAGLLLAACALTSEAQLRYWKDNESLFARALAVTHDNATAHVNLGVTLEQQGQLQEALKHYEAALRINPELTQAHNNAANLLDELGKPDEALAHYREALRLKPNAALAHANLATLLVKLGQYDEAMRHYLQAAELSPEDPRPHYLMGKADLRSGRHAQAVAHFRDAIRLDPNNLKSLTWLARVQAADQSKLIRNGPDAVVLAERANSLTEGHQPFVLDTLAMAYAETGRFTEAVQTQRKAIDLAASAEDKQTLSMLREHLRCYESNQPWRDAFTNSPP
jgi:protein O-mannosyl-transferase